MYRCISIFHFFVFTRVSTNYPLEEVLPRRERVSEKVMGGAIALVCMSWNGGNVFTHSVTGLRNGCDEYATREAL